MTTAVEPARAEQSLWRPMIAALGKTAGGSIASGLLSAVGTKIIAARLGPGSIALVATLQQLRDGAVTVATANGRTALVQGASALQGVERREYLGTVLLLFAGGTLLVAAAMLTAPATIARWSRLPASSESLLPWLAATVVLLSAFVFLTAILNALREIGKLALVQVAAPLAAAVVAWPVAAEVRAGHPWSLTLLLAIPAALAVAAAAIALRGHRAQLREWFRGPGRWWSFSTARGFLAISGAMLVSGLAATTVLLAVRGSITRHEGLAMTGQFDAAWNISMNQVSLILGSVQAYYLPTLAAAKGAGERARQIRGMLTIATLATVPAIVALAVLKPLAVHILYSAQFASSPEFLRWTLVGDYLKVSSWVLAAPMLATREVGAFLASDLLTHAIFFGSAMLFARIVKPAEGAAIAFLVSYAAYFALCYGYARARHGLRFGPVGFSVWLTGLALILGATANAWSDSNVHLARASFWILLAIGFSAGFAIYIRRREA
jgi:O-antigen/teichoic acid export membrane protein